ncbi:hypothetical protein MMC12_001213 [Toensbergia leucococca]|nr:hypothetical protein [Toensbergia leucococca]
MISLSWGGATRKSAWTCLSCSAISPASQVLISGSPRPLAIRTHQRTYSSSKPSSPPKDDARPIAAPTEAPTAETSPAVEDAPKRSSTRLSRRKPRVVLPDTDVKRKEDPIMNLPIVPSTQHLHPNGRVDPLQYYRKTQLTLLQTFTPISVTVSVPPTSSPTAFSSIFALSKNRNQKLQPSDVIYTLSSTFSNLENASQQSAHQSGQETQSSTPRLHQMTAEELDLRTAITQASTSNADDRTHLDGPQPIHLDLQDLARNFRPFVAPPPPVPMSSLANKTQIHPPPSSSQKSYSTILTILESTHPSGRKTFKTHTSPLLETSLPHSQNFSQTSDDAPSISMHPPPHQPFLTRMLHRQEAWEDYREGVRGDGMIWRAISVKRQRKLKMKKHKYKKLMKRNRNLRRKLDKL